MNPFLSTKSDNKKIKPWNLPGALGFEGFEDFEIEKPVTSALDFVGEVIVDAVSLAKQEVAGVEPTNENPERRQISPTGSIEFAKAQAKQEEDAKQKEVAANKRIFYQALKEEVARVENAKDRMIYEEELADIGAHMSTEEKNELLHYQANYKDKSIYQMAELRKKLIEQKAKSEKQEKEVSIAETQTKGKTAMQGIFEGASGTQGGGQANLSFQAAG